MKKLFPDLEIVFPPFNGFPEEGIRFLKNLKRNNNRVWFNKHKIEYEKFLKIPMQSLIAELKPLIHKFAPDFIIDPKKSIFRIYRDTRFSKNKAPYKTHISAIFQPTKHWNDSASLYLHIEPGGVYLAAGMYMPDNKRLKEIRKAILENSEEFKRIISSKSFKKYFKNIEGNKLLRMPLGFPETHPLSEYIKLKQFYISYELPENACYSKTLVKNVVKIFEKMMFFVNFLNKAIIKN